MKYICVLFCLLMAGCLQSERVLVEINEVPPPFSLGGNNPYVVWMNGKRVNLPKGDLEKLVRKVGRENIPKINPADIHKGWLWPHHAKREELPKYE